MTSATDNRTTELLPCPFCGGEGQTQEAITNLDEHIGWKAHCENEMCFASCNLLIYPTEEEAIAAWNQRYQPTCHIVECSRKYVLSDGTELFDDGCSVCNGYVGDGDNYCANCGARICKEVDNAYE